MRDFIIGVIVGLVWMAVHDDSNKRTKLLLNSLYGKAAAAPEIWSEFARLDTRLARLEHAD